MKTSQKQNLMTVSKKWIYLNIFFLLSISIMLLGTLANAQNASQNNVSGKTGSPSDINFMEEGHWNDVVKRAENDKKYIFVDAYASWCGPCKQLKATTFKDKEIAAFFNEHFINASFDVEKGEGPALAKKWKIQGLPTLMIFDMKGKLIAQSVGYIGAKDLKDFAIAALMKK